MVLIDIAKTTAALRAQSGTEPIADLGVVHAGKFGYAACTVGLAIERWQGLFLVVVTVAHRKNRAGVNTRALAWPYSRVAAGDVDRVLADFETIADILPGATLPDRRGWVERTLDRLMAADHLGTYVLQSQLQDPAWNRGEVTARVVRWRGATHVALDVAGSSGAAQFPQEACQALRRSLADWAAGRPD